MAEGLIKVVVCGFLGAFWALLLLQQHYSDSKIESQVRTDVQQSYRKRNLFLRDVQVEILGKGAPTAKNELPIKVHVTYKPPYCSEDPTPARPVNRTVELLVSKSDSGKTVIKSRQGIELSNIREMNVL